MLYYYYYYLRKEKNYKRRLVDSDDLFKKTLVIVISFYKFFLNSIKRECFYDKSTIFNKDLLFFVYIELILKIVGLFESVDCCFAYVNVKKGRNPYIRLYVKIYIFCFVQLCRIIYAYIIVISPERFRSFSFFVCTSYVWTFDIVISIWIISHGLVKFSTSEKCE